VRERRGATVAHSARPTARGLAVGHDGLHAETLNSVVEDREEAIVTRAGHDPVVMVALDDYQSLRETAYLLRSPANARRLLASIDRLENGGGAEHELAEG
jgi:antitoxin YefM